jgi:hypothetical protein
LNTKFVAMTNFAKKFVEIHLTKSAGRGVALPDGGSDLGPNSGNGGVPGNL